MRVLFFMRNFSGYFRQFEPALRELLERGHQVHVVRDRKDEMRGEQWAEALQADHPAFTWSKALHPRTDSWSDLKRQVRLTTDYLYFLQPEYEQSTELVRRARRRAPDRIVRLMDSPDARLRRPAAVHLITRVLRAIESATPSSRALRRFIRGHQPDVVLLTPHLMPGSPQQEVLRAAMDAGFRTGLCVASWDNLSSKQLIRVVPDVVTVWNETQKREALDIHGLPPGCVTMTGAQVYDPWFDWQPRSRESFCARVGLPADRPYLLYAAGALFPASITEAQFVVERWLPALRASEHAQLREAAVLVRPHPKRFEEWSAAEFDGFGPLALWPREGRMPVDEAARADFYDSIYHSAGVFGVNTSAMIEAGIVGKRVHTLLVPEFEGSQHGTLHFRYLTEAGGGLLVEALDLDQHLDQLADSVRAGGAAPDANREFVEAFVRPQGIDQPAASVFADTIERVAALGPARPARKPLRHRALRVALEPVRLGFRHWGATRLRRNRRRRKAARAAARAAGAG